MDAYFFWQLIGGGLMTVAPAVTYSLKVWGGGVVGMEGGVVGWGGVRMVRFVGGEVQGPDKLHRLHEGASAATASAPAWARLPRSRSRRRPPPPPPPPPRATEAG